MSRHGGRVFHLAQGLTVWFFLVVLVAYGLWPNRAFADGTAPQSGWSWTGTGYDGNTATQTGATVATVCALVAAWSNAHNQGAGGYNRSASCQSANETSGAFVLDNVKTSGADVGTHFNDFLQATAAPVCGAGATLGTDGQCHVTTCPAGQHIGPSGQCIPDCASGYIQLPDGSCTNRCASFGGQPRDFEWSGLSGQSTHVGCIDVGYGGTDGCAFSAKSDFAGSNDGVHWNFSGPGTLTGGACTLAQGNTPYAPDVSGPSGGSTTAGSSGSGSSSPTDSGCPSNQVAQVVGSKTLCVPKDQPVTAPVCPAGEVASYVQGLTLCAPAWQVAQGGQTSTTNPDGSTSTKSSDTTCTGSSCVTTTTVGGTNPDGSAKTPQVTTSTSDKGSFCAQSENAKTPACKGVGTGADSGTSFNGGDCNTPPVCNGDAVACATAAQLVQIKCDHEKEISDANASPEGILGSQMMNGTDPLQSSFPTVGNATTTDLSGTQWDESGFLGGGSCFAPTTFTVFHKTLTIDWSGVCGKLEYLKYFGLFITSIACFLILKKPVIG